MASDIDIANLALARLGDTANVPSLVPPDGSAQAAHCARFYPFARNTLLELHEWGFATRRAVLALTGENVGDWAYAYALPSDALRVIDILPQSAGEGSAQDYSIEANADSRLILTDQEGAVVRYVGLVTDATRFSPLFVEALSWLLASHLAGPLIKGDAGAGMAKSCYQTAMMLVAQARASDAGQRKGKPGHLPAWIGSR